MDIHDAIQSFTEWNMPWLFEEAVRSSLTNNDVQLFNAAWAEALNEDNWKDSDLSKCSSIAEARLRKAFAMLTDQDINALTRAASYQWR